ncbi:MAG: hypothetical protein H7Z42_02655 [Roseiflexaceae bacterium]|nr:hypothetical protein [Roseiflexaceae bacterium]
MTTRICIVSDDVERRAAFKAMLAHLPNVAIVGEIGESTALRLLVPLAPNLILLDATTPGLNPITMLQILLNTPVIVLAATASQNEQQLFQELGARAVVPPNQFDRLTSILGSMVGEAEQHGNTPLRPHQPRRRWADNVSTVLTRH